jgi:hypothetical protein
MPRPLFDISSINLLETDIQIDKELCSICLDEMDNPNTIYKIEDCNHMFHTKCILEMYIKSEAKSCPNCRHYISVTDNTGNATVKFKMDLIKKYVKKKDANTNVVNFYTEYVNYNKKLFELKKELVSVQRDITVLKKDNKAIFKEKDKLDENLLELKNFMKSNILCFTSRYRRYRRALCNKNSLKFIKDIIKDASTEITNKINEQVESVEDDLSKIKENDVFKNYNILEKKKKKINTQQAKLQREQSILQNSMLSIPIRPVNV